MTATQPIKLGVLGAIGAGLLALSPVQAFAHCDTLDGPVVVEAKTALEAGNVEPILKWVAKEEEQQLRHVFEHAQRVRKLGGDAAALADRFFFETLVRVHRASEGEPYTGLKPAGLDHGPVVPAADQALEAGSIDKLTKLVLSEAQEGLSKRFQEAVEKKRHAAESIEAGRAFVHAYVEFIHYAERLFRDATTSAAHTGAGHEAHGELGVPAAGHVH